MRYFSAVVVTAALASCATSKPIAGSSTGAGAPSAPIESVSCGDLKYGNNGPVVTDAASLCSHYRDEFLPAVATAAVGCMQAAGWSVCDVGPCAMNALASVSPEKDARCNHVEQKCPGMDELCAAYIAGMKPAGRERFAACLVDHCGFGVRYCLWDAMVSPCDLGGDLRERWKRMQSTPNAVSFKEAQ